MLKTHPSYNTYGRRTLILPLADIRSFHSSSVRYDDKSKIEKTVNLLKKDSFDEAKAKQAVPSLPSTTTTTTTVPAVRLDASLLATAPAESTVIKRKSIWERIVHELKHYYNGFKLLFIETKIAFRLFRQVLNGHTLTRRERKQVYRKIATDFCSIVPFISVYSYHC